MKIALINISSSTFKYENSNSRYPLGLLYLGALVKKDHDVCVLDYQLNSYVMLKDIVRKLEEIEPDVVGISTTLDITLFSTKQLARAVRKRFPRTVIMVGGITAFFLKDDLIKEPNVDIIVLGEGEIPFQGCIQCLDSNKDLASVPGVMFKNKSDGRIMETPRPPLIENLDSLPFPDFDLIEEEMLNNLPISSSRGCGMGCVYCSSTAYWKTWRTRSAENVIEEIETLRDKYALEKVHFVDENFCFDRKRVKRFCQLLKARNINIIWGGSARPELLNREILEIMKDAGCRGIFIGAESGSQRILEKIKRPYSPEKVEEVVNECLDVGIMPTVSFIIGLPGEDREDIDATVMLMKRLRTYSIEVGLLYPLYGTPIYNHPETFGLRLLTEKKNRFIPNIMQSFIESENFTAKELESLYYRGLGVIQRKKHTIKPLMKKIFKEEAHAFQ